MARVPPEPNIPSTELHQDISSISLGSGSDWDGLDQVDSLAEVSH